MNKKILEALIFSDALSSLEENQKYLYDNIDKIILYNSNFHKNFNENQHNLFPQNNDLDNYLKVNEKQNGV